VPGNSTKKDSSISRDSISKSLLGSSSTNTFAFRVNILAKIKRLRSPPEKYFTGERARSGENKNSFKYEIIC
jgi:hypothetical protein